MKTLITVALSACLAMPAMAATFNVSPIRVGLSAQRKSMPLTVSNEGDESIVVQVHTMRWTQELGEDIYTRTDDILAAPPIFTIAAHGSQIVRIGLRRAVDPARELAYRVYLTEVPGSAKPGATGVQMSLRIGLPVFVTGPALPTPKLHWSLAKDEAGTAKLRLRNEGNAHAQVSDIRLLSIADAKTLARQAAPAYLLGGTTREWTITPESGMRIGTDRIKLQAYMDGGDVNIELAPEPQ
ncbi:MAG: fimbria/pilus periplasmic chaperone [Pseudomonadota bacterium]